MGLVINRNKYDLIFETRWTFGFATLDRTAESDVYNNVISFMFGVGWSLSPK